MNKRLERMLTNYSRRLSLSWEPRIRAKNKAKVAPALHRCSKCGKLCYEGDSQRSYEKYVKQFPNDEVMFDGIHMDHILPVEDINDVGPKDWNKFFSRLFCDEDNYRALCPTPCHKSKSDYENSNRKRRKKAKGKK